MRVDGFGRKARHVVLLVSVAVVATAILEPVNSATHKAKLACPPVPSENSPLPN